MMDDLVTMGTDWITPDLMPNNLSVLNKSLNLTEVKHQPAAVHIVLKTAFVIQMLIFVFGLFGNALTIIVLRTKRLRQSSTTVYLTALAIVDLLYIISSMLVNIFNTTVFFPSNIRNHSAWACPLTSFVQYTLTYLSVWLMVSVTIERAIWVGQPFRAKHICTQRNATLTIVSLTIVLVLLDSHFFFTTTYKLSNDGSGGFECTPNYFARIVFPYIDMLLICCLPIISMIGANIVIGMRLKKMREFNRKRKGQSLPTLYHSSCGTSFLTPTVIQENQQELETLALPSKLSCSDTVHSPRKFSKKAWLETRDSIKVRSSAERSSSLTRMLVAISVFFIVSVSPLMIYDIIYFALDVNKYVEQDDPDRVFLVFAIEKTVYTLWYTNFAVHFIIYCLNGPPFRAKALSLFHSLFICCHWGGTQQAVEVKIENNEATVKQPSRRFVTPTLFIEEPTKSENPVCDQTNSSNGRQVDVFPTLRSPNQHNLIESENTFHSSHMMNNLYYSHTAEDQRETVSNI